MYVVVPSVITVKPVVSVLVEQLPCKQVVIVTIVVEITFDDSWPEDSVDSNDAMEDLDVVSDNDELRFTELDCTIELGDVVEDRGPELPPELENWNSVGWNLVGWN